MDNKKYKTVLFLFSSNFPFTRKSGFIHNELPYLSNRFDKIFILPYYKKEEIPYEFPGNIEAVYLYQDYRYNSWPAFCNDWMVFFKIMFFEFFQTRSKKAFLRNLRTVRSALLQALSKSHPLIKFLEPFRKEKVFFYSFWFSEWATILSVLKMKGIIQHYVSRSLGFDMREDDWEGGIIPCRYFQLQWVDRLFSDAKDSMNRYRDSYPEHYEKFDYSYLGVEDYGTNEIAGHSATFTILSSANIIPIKRVHLLAMALAYCDFPVRWIHMGDGPMRPDVEDIISRLPENIRVTLTGHISFKEIIEIYRKNPVNLFVHTSNTDTIPVVLLEAAGFGIPLMACKVGGISEIVNENTGILLPVNITPYDLAVEIKNFRTSRMNSTEFRKSVKNFWFQSFHSPATYNQFIDKLKIIHGFPEDNC